MGVPASFGASVRFFFGAHGATFSSAALGGGGVVGGLGRLGERFLFFCGMEVSGERKIKCGTLALKGVKATSS